MEEEEWLPVPGYEGFYEVSNSGRVRGVTRQIERTDKNGRPYVCTYHGKEKVHTVDVDGYHAVSLYRGSACFYTRVGRLVLAAFDRLPLEKEEARHKDHNPGNNALSNLCWGTRQDNEDDKTNSGRRPVSTRGMLTMEKAREIRARFAAGETYRQLEQAYNMHYSNIWLVVKGKTWRE